MSERSPNLSSVDAFANTIKTTAKKFNDAAMG
jgi:hypothetical protein